MGSGSVNCRKNMFYTLFCDTVKLLKVLFVSTGDCTHIPVTIEIETILDLKRGLKITTQNHPRIIVQLQDLLLKCSNASDSDCMGILKAVSKYQPDVLLWNEWTYCEVVVDELRPAKQVSQPIKGSQLAAQQLLALVVGDGVRATQIIDWSHHSQTCEERKKRQSHIQQLDGFCHWNLTRVFVLKSTLACSALLIVSTDTAGLRSRSHTQPFSSLLTHIECRHASLWCCRVHGRHTGGHEICNLLQSQ